ncbi:MAG: 23S rRNA (adenine(2503)-C(2))-methyltransferase RlmN [Oceanococcus sp.]|nr:MAG: 23S rRNA (adenine(2503)-C(2))-methyltransferase RlmN [Oceanococcus sp.]
MTQAAPTNLLGMDRPALEQWFAALGERPFRARQLMQWMYQRSEPRFEAMTDIAKALREQLQDIAEVRTPELITEQVSADGTRKWLLRVDEGNAVETVFIPEAARGTLCISSQVGCAMDCQFCATATQGFSRNLSASEILGQVWFAQKALNAVPREQRVISNVVFMGMGEPLANFDQVVMAIRVLLDDLGYGLSKRRVTVSTSGLVPFIDRLRETVDTALAVSLHAADDDLRNEIVPINRKYPLSELMAACRRYTDGKDRHVQIVYEYVMLDGVNDSAQQARALAALLRGLPAKVNLIPFNPFQGTSYKTSKPEAVQAFAEILRGKRIVTTTRKTRGDDIDAACGQLVGQVKNRQRRRLSEIPVVVQS